jgi:N-acetylglutamate synthase-like GNAT family acetyltransferase
MEYLNENKIFIRQYHHESDSKGVQQLEFGILDEFDLSRLKEFCESPEFSFAKKLKEDNQLSVSHILERDDDKKIVGTAFMVPYNEKKDIAILHNVYLDPSLRGHGIGKMIVESLIRQAKTLKYDKIFLLTRSEFTVALKMYKNLGFVQVKNPHFDSPRSLALELKLIDQKVVS